MAWDRAVPAAVFHAVPAPLVAAFDFMNTLDERTFGDHEPADELTDPAALARHLDVGACAPADLRLGLRLRAALRAAARANRTGDPVPVLDDLGRELPLRADAALGLAPLDGGTRGALANLLAAVVIAEADGSWRRMKACGAPDCGWVFYDHSKPRNARWCSTAGCGNRMKTRAYRTRLHGHAD